MVAVDRLSTAKVTKATASPAAGDTVKSERGKAKEVKKHHHAFVARADKHCQIKSCKREYRAKGYCRAHYKMWRQGKYGHRRFTACHDQGCFKPMGRTRHGYCEEHYQSYYIKGVAHAKPEAEKPAAKAPVAAAG